MTTHFLPSWVQEPSPKPPVASKIHDRMRFVSGSHPMRCVARATGTPGANILVAASHNHSGPGYAGNPGWARDMVAKITGAAAQARAALSRYGAVTEVELSSGSEP